MTFEVDNMDELCARGLSVNDNVIMIKTYKLTLVTENWGR